VIATADATIFRVAVIFARWAVCGVMKLSTNYTHRAQLTLYGHVLGSSHFVPGDCVCAVPQLKFCGATGTENYI